MGVVDWVDRLQRRHPVFGFPLAVIYKFFDDAGGYLAALLTYYAFLSFFPVLLLLSTVLSILLRNHPEWQEDVLNSALSQFPVIGDQLGDPRSLSGGAAGVAIGSALAIYGALGAGNALQYTMNTVWAVPRNSRPNPFLARLRSGMLILTAGLAAIATTVVSTFAAATTGWGVWTKVATTLLTLVINTGIVMLCFRIGVRGTARRHQVAGAIITTLAWQLLQTFGVVFVGRVVKGASATNGIFALVIGLLAFIYLISVVVVLSAEVNVVHARRLYPRALLTPFTDNVDLTEADKQAYAAQARAMRSKGYERIHVEFGRRGDPPDDDLDD
ncbi:YihY/virulence factor BrkB family protein [Nostocoides australiense]|nr:YihY/virulence factor BrkB family protein [Actinomycetota bacterium]MCB1300286.1 YihY/virulence factor BrkB family protein [Tetrasphaera sp.]HPF81834.1 YihY/virulence factor BrkB family protein [Tetrasphaera australiensis]HRW02492.1 YihY/virulence factor BrkB family protein [Tetrasphaera sp.]